MKYAAFLRGVNVGGKNITPMASLKQCLEEAGLANVKTVLQSGNVIFESEDRSLRALTMHIERAVSKALRVDAAIVLLSEPQLQSVVDDAPGAWKRGNQLRRNIAFLRPPVIANQALTEVDIRPGVDTVTAGKGVIYMATVMSALSKSRLKNVIGTPVYRQMTIRTYGTCQKILALMRDGPGVRR
jgi:uncharacterized protein (DUF1697 family)